MNWEDGEKEREGGIGRERERGRAVHANNEWVSG